MQQVSSIMLFDPTTVFSAFVAAGRILMVFARRNTRMECAGPRPGFPKPPTGHFVTWRYSEDAGNLDGTLASAACRARILSHPMCRGTQARRPSFTEFTGGHPGMLQQANRCEQSNHLHDLAMQGCQTDCLCSRMSIKVEACSATLLLKKQVVIGVA